MLTEKALKETGISEYGLISPKRIVFSEEIRDICKKNTCRRYGTTWGCPPAVGTVEECRARALAFENAMVFNAVYPLEDSFDYEGMMAGHKAFKNTCDRLYELVKPEYERFLLLSNESCGRCERCTYPEGACRMPETLFPALEGYGINVMELSKAAGIKYINGKNTVTYFGMLLY